MIARVLLFSALNVSAVLSLLVAPGGTALIS
jgi:hypothetical protein